MTEAERMFAGHPQRLRLFRAVRAHIERLGPVVMRDTESQVSFRARRTFAWVWLPQRWTHNRPEESVTLTFSLDHRESDPRIVEAVEPHPGHWTHHVVIEDETDLDGAVDGWLREAYRLAA
jgi:hypothetical protein